MHTTKLGSTTLHVELTGAIQPSKLDYKSYESWAGSCFGHVLLFLVKSLPHYIFLNQLSHGLGLCVGAYGLILV